jgi:cell division protein FtsN
VSACAASPNAKAHEQASFIRALLVSIVKRNCAMAKKSVFRQSQLVDRPLPRLPHPSWRWALPGADSERQGRAAIGSADDFWTRLGL